MGESSEGNSPNTTKAKSILSPPQQQQRLAAEVTWPHMWLFPPTALTIVTLFEETGAQGYVLKPTYGSILSCGVTGEMGQSCWVKTSRNSLRSSHSQYNHFCKLVHVNFYSSSDKLKHNLFMGFKTGTAGCMLIIMGITQIVSLTVTQWNSYQTKSKPLMGFSPAWKQIYSSL